MPYPAQLLAVITATEVTEKAGLLATVRLPDPDETWPLADLPLRPGRPAHYREVATPPRRHRTLKHEPTRLRFLHAIHHIEMSAIDLACAVALAGSGMPVAFHSDQIAVAREEAEHAALVETLLVRRGFPPGSDPIHHRLWEAARACADLGELLVVIPRFLEARGLDVSADLLPRLATMDAEAHAVIARIYQDEVGHVGIGTRWHHVWCQAHGFIADDHFAAVARRHFATQIPGPFALDRLGRQQAGFSEAEMAFLETPTARAADPFGAQTP